ncbi:MAG: helix-turn-helix domain-containing protein [Candidatus Dormiibacterota bacterium]
MPQPQPRPARSKELPARQLSDPRSIRALAHPIRLALLQQLTLEGPLTATAAAAIVGESPSSCSFHLRQLSKYGFVEPAPGGRGRERPWRASHVSLAIVDDEGEPGFELATDELLNRFIDHSLSRFQASLHARRAYPAKWRRALPIQQSVLFVTPTELTKWVEDQQEVWHRFDHRIADRTLRPAGSRSVEVLLLSYPLSEPQQRRGTSRGGQRAQRGG